MQVAHAVRGDGTVVEINWCDPRDKPYLVQFSTGEVRPPARLPMDPMDALSMLRA